MSYRARLVIDADDAEIVEKLLERFADGTGTFQLQIGEVDVGADGELVRHTLRPLRVETLSLAATASATARGLELDERMGPLVRIYATRPTEEEQDGRHGSAADAAAT